MTQDSGYLVVKADSIFCQGKGFIRDSSLLIRNGLIEKISVHDDDAKAERVLDFRGCSLSPPLCDYHLHFSIEASGNEGGIEAVLKKHGIAKVFEGGEAHLSGIEMKKALQRRVDVKSCGYALYKKGGYGRSIGRPVENSREARLQIDELLSLGIDYLKVIHSGIFMPESGEISAGGFSEDELKEVVDYATGKGLPVVCHANGERAVRDAVHAGVSAIVHGFLVSDDTLAQMSEKGVAFIPTVKALESLKERTGDPEAQLRIDLMVDGHLSRIGRAKERGVRILPGSDSAASFLPYGGAYTEELRFLVKAGLSVEEVLTAGAAGALAEGERAQLIVLKGLEVEGFFDGAMLCQAETGGHES